MSYIHIPHERPLDHRTAFQLLQIHAKKQPNKEAIVFRDEKLSRVSLTFQEYDTKSISLAAGLLEIGVCRGDRVLVLLPSYVEFVLFHMALNRIGAVMIAVEESDYPAVCGTPQLACVIARVEPSVPDNNKVINEIKMALDQNKLKAAVLVGSDADIKLIDHSKAYSHHDLYAMAERNLHSVTNVRNAEARVQMDDPCLVLFTSGSTSLPKPIEYTHHAFVNGFCTVVQQIELTTDSVYFTDSPFDWISGINFSIGPCIDQGLTYVSLTPKIAICGKHVMTIMKILQEECVTHAVFLLYLLQDIAMHDEEIKAMNLNNFQFVITGGQPTPLPLINKILQLWPTVKFINACGSTEASSIFRQIISNDNIDSLDYGIMEVIPGMEIKIVDEQGRLLPNGQLGEICLRSSWVSFCNWDYMDPELKGREHTETNRNGWHFTKDVGVVVNGNFIRLLGRLDFMIKVAAESVPPALVESTLQEHPDIKKVCVVGVPDDRLYQKICACIVLKESHHDNKAVLSNQFDQWGKDKFWESSIGFVIKPHYYVFLDSFPLTRTGKLNRKEVRDIAIKELGLMK